MEDSFVCDVWCNYGNWIHTPGFGVDIENEGFTSCNICLLVLRNVYCDDIHNILSEQTPRRRTLVYTLQFILSDLRIFHTCHQFTIILKCNHRLSFKK
ncbi:unnamed protein product [Schistosoma mattheei]|uniref:Uncharacterized protein n=1 Tax=Schistosoma mattheei TaxID=31246 RepID=A0AA85AQS1_9TREM|nr:unnamed protein product [Schistosoma mattheei]